MGSCIYAATFFHNNMYYVQLLYKAAIAAAVFKEKATLLVLTEFWAILNMGTLWKGCKINKQSKTILLSDCSVIFKCYLCDAVLNIY